MPSGNHTKTLDCVVAGLGGVGSAALFYARQHGWDVLGIDRFGAAHTRGSSHGQTRIIRTAYFEHPNYVPLTRRSFSMWDEVQSQSRQNLLTKCGLLQIGDPDGEVVRGVLQSANEHGLDIETLSPDQICERYPILKKNEGQVGLFEKQAGFLRVERCVANFVSKAVEAGADTCMDSVVESWSVLDDGLIEVRTDHGDVFRTKRLIIAAGAWAETVLGLSLELQVVRKQQHWFQLDHIGQKLGNGFPCFLVDGEDGCFYGSPEFDYLGMKAAEHGGGKPVPDPLNVDRKLDKQELANCVSFLERNFHFTRQRLVHHSVCMYTRSSDEHFLIDHHPVSNQVVFAAGLSGHGFKFAPVLGKRLVEMLEGVPDELFDFLKMAGRSETKA